MFEDDLPAAGKASAAPKLLGPLSIAELEGYIVALKAEIVRTEAEIARKKAHRDAASSSFFKS